MLKLIDVMFVSVTIGAFFKFYFILYLVLHPVNINHCLNLFEIVIKVLDQFSCIEYYRKYIVVL